MNRGKKTGNWFLLVYFISITVILIVWQLLPVANQFEHFVTGSLGEQKIELKDWKR